MRTVYGLRMMELEDIISRCGRPAAICDYLKNEILSGTKFEEYGPSIIIDTSLQGNIPIYNILNPYKMIFVPMEYVERKIIKDTMVDSLNTAKVRIVSSRQIDGLDKIIDKEETRLMDIADKYTTHEQIASSTCCMAIYIDDSRFIDVYTAVPEDIIESVLLSVQIYKCDHCGVQIETNNRSISGYIPEMRYEVTSEGQMLYYCMKCVDELNLQNLKHAGE